MHEELSGANEILSVLAVTVLVARSGWWNATGGS